MLPSCQQVEVRLNEVIAVIECVIHYLANRNHIPIIATLQKNKQLRVQKSCFYSKVIFLSRNMDLNNNSNESAADQRWLKYCLHLRTQVHFGLSFWLFLSTSICFVTYIPSNLHRWQFIAMASDGFIWPMLSKHVHWPILFQRWGNWDQRGKELLTVTLSWLVGNSTGSRICFSWLLIRFSLLPSKPSCPWYDFKMSS